MAKPTSSPISIDITLQEPLKRGDNEITALTLRRPSAGELRGCQLMTLLAGDTDQVIRVASRITTPVLTEHELQQMNPADVFAIAAEISGFLAGSRSVS